MLPELGGKRVIGLTVPFSDSTRLHPLTKRFALNCGPATPGAFGKLGDGPPSLICQSKVPTPPGPIVRLPLIEVPGLLPAENLPPFCVTMGAKFVPAPL